MQCAKQRNKLPPLACSCYRSPFHCRRWARFYAWAGPRPTQRFCLQLAAHTMLSVRRDTYGTREPRPCASSRRWLTGRVEGVGQRHGLNRVKSLLPSRMWTSPKTPLAAGDSSELLSISRSLLQEGPPSRQPAKVDDAHLEGVGGPGDSSAAKVALETGKELQSFSAISWMDHYLSRISPKVMRPPSSSSSPGWL